MKNYFVFQESVIRVNVRKRRTERGGRRESQGNLVGRSPKPGKKFMDRRQELVCQWCLNSSRQS